jgi:hypothetical protein
MYTKSFNVDKASLSTEVTKNPSINDIIHHFSILLFFFHQTTLSLYYILYYFREHIERNSLLGKESITQKERPDERYPNESIIKHISVYLIFQLLHMLVMFGVLKSCDEGEED